MKPETLMQVIENMRSQYRDLGYVVISSPVAGHEIEYEQTLRAGLEKIEITLHFLNKHYGFRGRSKRALRALHEELPEPIWGVQSVLGSRKSPF